jgi:uncharacterized membrane protein YidH (DUF202 family)
MRLSWYKLGLAVAAVGIAILIVAYILIPVLPPVDHAPYTILGNIPAFLFGFGLTLAVIGILMMYTNLNAEAKRLDLSLVPEAFEITRNVIVFSTILTTIISATLLTALGIMPISAYVNIVMFILGSIVGGTIAYALLRAG